MRYEVGGMKSRKTSFLAAVTLWGYSLQETKKFAFAPAELRVTQEHIGVFEFSISLIGVLAKSWKVQNRSFFLYMYTKEQTKGMCLYYSGSIDYMN